MAVLPLSSSNPFLPRESVSAYELTPTTPEVDLGELESAHAQTLEVRVSWGDQILKVQHLQTGSFSVGEGTDIPVPANVLGSDTLEVARYVGGQAEVYDPASGGYAAVDADGSTFAIGEFTFEVALTKAGKKPLVPFMQRLADSAGRHVGLSFFLHAAVIGALAYYMPNLGNDDAEAMSRDQILMMQKLLDTAVSIEKENLDQTGNQAPEAGDVGERAKGESGSMGSTMAAPANARWAKKGPSDNANPELSREALKAEIATSGMIGLLATANLADPDAPVSPWGNDAALGKDPLSVQGNMWGDTIGAALGMGGLDLTGTGIGGGGDGTGVGLGSVGTGHGLGLLGGPGGLGTCGADCGMGRGHGLNRMNHTVKKISAREMGPTSVNGHLPAEVIQRIVRQNFGRFRNCYESALRNNPGLGGRVVTRFVIDRTGAVSTASDGGSDLPDRSAVSCVVRSFGGLSFPQPEGGIVTVSYPIVFSPGE